MNNLFTIKKGDTLYDSVRFPGKKLIVRDVEPDSIYLQFEEPTDEPGLVYTRDGRYDNDDIIPTLFPFEYQIQIVPL